jgi:hypothetical protein
MAAENTGQTHLEIAHVLFIDIVGYSKLSINDQNAAVEELPRSCAARAVSESCGASRNQQLIEMKSSAVKSLILKS